MPKSKRNKVVSLTAVRPKGVELKKNMFDEIRRNLDQFESVYIFSYKDIKTTKIHEIRESWPNSKFFLGKNRVVAVAFGKTEEDEYKTNLHKLNSLLTGPKGLFFTNEQKKKVTKWFKALAEKENLDIKLEATWTNSGKITKFAIESDE